MNTEQNYVGKGDYANTPPQAAQNQAQTFPTDDNREADFAPINLGQISPPQVDWKFFEVNSDSLNPIMWKGDILATVPVDSLNYPETNSLIVVEHRSGGEYPQGLTIGWLSCTDQEFIELAYDKPRLIIKQQKRVIPMRDIVRVFKVETISRVAN